MDITEEMVEKLASKFDEEELGVFVGLLDKVAATAAAHVMTKEQQLDKIAADLAASGCSLQEIQGELQKMAEEKAVQDECEKIASDCVAMGNIIGNTASEVFLNNIRGFISKHAAEEEEEEEEGKKGKSNGFPPKVEVEVETEEEEEGKEKEEEKEASAHREALRSILLQAAKLS